MLGSSAVPMGGSPSQWDPSWLWSVVLASSRSGAGVLGPLAEAASLVSKV